VEGEPRGLETAVEGGCVVGLWCWDFGLSQCGGPEGVNIEGLLLADGG
jgi:hypothetical protein